MNGEEEYLNSFREFRIPFAIHPNRLCGISLVEVSLSVVQRQNSKSFLASQQSASWLGYFTSLRQYCIIPSIIASSLLLGRESVTNPKKEGGHGGPPPSLCSRIGKNMYAPAKLPALKMASKSNPLEKSVDVDIALVELGGATMLA